MLVSRVLNCCWVPLLPLFFALYLCVWGRRVGDNFGLMMMIDVVAVVDDDGCLVLASTMCSLLVSEGGVEWPLHSIVSCFTTLVGKARLVAVTHASPSFK